MSLRIKNQVDFLAGLVFTVLGLAFAIQSLPHQLGTAGEMGPGYFPLMLGLLLALLGLVVLASSTITGDENDRLDAIRLRPVFLVTSAVVLFGLLLIPLGLVGSSFVLVILSASASQEFRWRYALITALVMVVISYILFVYGLGLPIPTWPKD